MSEKVAFIYKEGVEIIVRGYHGYYKGIYLRSSLEFAYAYYLDCYNIKWCYEMNTYKLDNNINYKPDFFILNSDNKIIKIIEVKGEGNKQEGLIKIKLFKQKYDIPIELITYKDILQIYREKMSISYNKAKEIFINKYSAKIDSQDLFGKNNPMYGIEMNSNTKLKISNKAKERFKDIQYKKKFMEFIKNRKPIQKGYIKSEREIRLCKYCGKEFIVTIYSKRKYCSPECSSLATSKIARNCNSKKKELRNEKIKQYIIQWTIENKNILQTTPYNKIKKTLKPMLNYIYDNYNIKDIRIIMNIFNCTKRKNFLDMLKNI